MASICRHQKNHIDRKTAKNYQSTSLSLRDADATHIFHAFHEGSAAAYKQLVLLEKHNVIEMDPKEDPTLKGTVVQKEVNIGAYEYTVEQVSKDHYSSLRPIALGGRPKYVMALCRHIVQRLFQSIK